MVQQHQHLLDLFQKAVGRRIKYIKMISSKLNKSMQAIEEC